MRSCTDCRRPFTPHSSCQYECDECEERLEKIERQQLDQREDEELAAAERDWQMQHQPQSQTFSTNPRRLRGEAGEEGAELDQQAA